MQRIFSIFIGSIVISAIVLYTIHGHYRGMFAVEFLQVGVNCTVKLDEVDPPFPAILIDADLLNEIKDDRCTAKKQKISVAVDVNCSESVRQSDNKMYNIIYYEDMLERNYLRLFDTPTRIIPKDDFINHGNFSIPFDIKRFFEYWKRSKLIGCINMTIERKPMVSYLPVEKTVQAMSALVHLLVTFDIYPFFNGGTLLGWYRECGIIPHTKDVDFAAFIEEYNPNFLKHLQSGKSNFNLTRILGKVNDSYESTLRPVGKSRPAIDLFWMYSTENESWVGGSGGSGAKYKYTYPRITDHDICAGDLLNNIFWLPCDPQAIITTEYGPKWYKDHPTNNFSWSSSHYNVKKNGQWRPSEMKHVYKIY
ncbi:unnamed protein product [Cylicocyclus nassatus]|uniref:W02B3.4-like N-terminal domain-containing protein n=1 Tax=Cylicocyclus nassatus TaxID=53992 RepID=A0AA36M4Y1_CYLNA|nr:unnamed protein product [Cylicocyclus nassatus]